MAANYESSPKVITRLKFQAASPLDAQIKKLMTLETREAVAHHAQMTGKTPRIAFHTVHNRALNLGPTVESRGKDTLADERYSDYIALSQDHFFQLKKAITMKDQSDYIELGVNLHLLGGEKKLLIGTPLFAPNHDTGFELYTRIQRKNLLAGTALDHAYDLLENSMTIGAVDEMASWNMQVHGVEVEHEWPSLRPVSNE
ncbi:MAG: hypothetical protein JWN26_523 [Candidatus Saccharibacteria bacterium]|nr:hypothetical protein [Candidatus Saccharibacteria bacterium]